MSMGRSAWFVLVVFATCWALSAAVSTAVPDLAGEGTTEAGADFGGGSAAGAGAGEEAGTEEVRNCTPPAVREFPGDGLTWGQRRRGWAILHALLAAYLFVLLAIACDDYLVPSIKLLCARLGLPEDVAGATFMAAATSSPELFMNCVGTFITEGDIGVGTVVGSGVFNILAVPACCGLFAGKVVHLERWPLTRDSLAYAVTVLLLIGTLSDGRVEWWEAAAFVALYVSYVGALCRRGLCCRPAPAPDAFCASECSPLLERDPHKQNIWHEHFLSENNKLDLHYIDEHEDEGPCTVPEGASFCAFVWWLVTRPIKLLLHATVPDCRKRRRRHLYPLTFCVCMLWIAVTSYVVAWMITVVGDTLQIPDSVMGLTLLAAGTSLPEAVSSVIVTVQGYGAMGISNSIGSNTFNILLCLGLPWLLKAVFFPPAPGQYWVNINSGGLIYNTLSLLTTLLILYAAFACNSFKLDRKVGAATILMYLGYLAFAFAVELNVFGVMNMPTCPH